MRAMTIAMCIGVLLSSTALLARDGEKKLPFKLEHPGVVALSEPSPGKWVYRSFPALMPLYINDRDPPGKSMCYKSCALAWPPLRADRNAEPVGDWTVIEREDGIRQWAYKGKPVYMRFHDDTANPTGDGVNGMRLLVP